MTDPTTFDWPKHINECLTSTDFCCLGTVDAQHGVWSNPVYFAWDQAYNFYFVSQAQSRHMQNLMRDPRVSLAIYSTNQDSNEYVRGIQLEGRATIATDQDREAARQVYLGRAGGSPDDYKGWEFVRIAPDQMYYFDNRFFGEERQSVPWPLS